MPNHLKPISPNRLARERLEGTLAQTSTTTSPVATEDEEPLFNIPVTLGDQEALIPYYASFSPNETATAFCEVHWDSSSAGLDDEVIQNG